MVKYTLTQSPKTVLTVPGKDSSKAREKAMDQLIELVETGEVPADLSDGFSPNQFIEVKDQAPMPSDPDTAATPQNAEDAVTQAVQVLSNLATLKLKVQVSRAEAMKVRAQVDSLFLDDPVDEAELEQLKEGFKMLKTFAQANLRYREARVQAEQARDILDQALSFTDSNRKSEKSTK
ncbi:MAG TPA: hypothetical protein V6C78_29285 [Crinalium sp.]|jgi:hypothetical protein